jgi:AraC-like DNA-binding protein
MTTRGRRRTSVDAGRKRFNYIIDHYLRECYAKRAVARASELAQLLAANRTTLSRTVAEVLGQPLIVVMRERQLAEAARLLRATTLPVAEIAVRSGFGQPRSFYRAFRRLWGMTPGEYRIGNRQQNGPSRRA